MIYRFLLLSLLLAGPCALAQSTADTVVLPYLHGIRAKGALLLNVQGYDVIVESAEGNLTKPYFSKMFPGFDLHQGYKAIPDSSLGVYALRVDRSREFAAKDSAYAACYFVQKSPGQEIGRAHV